MRKSIVLMLMISVFALALVSCSDDDSTTANDNDIDTMPGMVLIEAADAEFEMGSDSGFDDESPVHNVGFSRNFWMDENEVTQAKYDSVMSAAYSNYFSPVWNNPYGMGENYPAFLLEWGDCALYCNALSRLAGLDSVYTYSSIIGTPGNLCILENVSSDITKNGYRLPTEAEWEYAYRGNSTSDFYWEKDYDPYPQNAADSTEISNYAVWYGNSWQHGNDDSGYGTHQIKSGLPNNFGLYDMSGNVWEWCHDWYGEYSADSQIDPSGPDYGDWHSIRGGSWANHAEYLRATNRTFYAPCYYYYLVGFRVVLPVVE